MKSIRSRLTIGLLAGSLAVLGLAGWIIYWMTRDALLSGLDARLRVQALSIIQQTRQGPDRHDQDKWDLAVFFASRYLPEFQENGTEYYQVWKAGGDSEERSASLEGADLPRKTGSLEQPAFWCFALPNGKRARAVGIEFVPETWKRRRFDPGQGFTAEVVVAGELGSVGETLATLRDVLLGVGGLAALAVVAGVPWLVWKGFRPLERLSADAATIDANRLSYRFPAGQVPSELQPIILRLNELFGRLEESFERERRFTSDAAHELRTPLAELRSLAEVSLKWPPDGAEAQAAFQDTLAIAQRLESLVVALLAIARCEGGPDSGKQETIRVNETLKVVWNRFEKKAAAKGLDVQWHLNADPALRGNRAILETIFTNLIVNAVDYTPVNGELEIRVATGGTPRANAPGNTVEVMFVNTAENLSPDDVPHLFERFWRKDQSRSDANHSGLGLAIVQAAAAALRLDVTAAWEPPDRLCIRLTGFASSPIKSEPAAAEMAPPASALA